MKIKALNFVTSIFLFSLLILPFQTGLARWAQGPESSAPVPQPQIPTWAQGDLQGCFMSFYEVAPKCLQGIFTSIIKGRLRLDPFCCEAIEVMSDKCWALICPTKPKVHLFLKAQCHPFGGSQPKDM